MLFSLLETHITDLLKLQTEIIETLPDEYDVSLDGSNTIAIERDNVKLIVRSNDNGNAIVNGERVEVSKLEEVFTQYHKAVKIYTQLKSNASIDVKLEAATTNISHSYGRLPGWAVYIKPDKNQHKGYLAVHVAFESEPGIAILGQWKNIGGVVWDNIKDYDYLNSDSLDDVVIFSTADEVVEAVNKILKEAYSVDYATEGLKSAAAGALIAAAAVTGSTGGHPTYIDKNEHQAEIKRMGFKNFTAQLEARAKALAEVITDKYTVSSDLALKVAKLALKYERPSFPKAEDILAVCGIESSFKPHAVSQLKHDPAVGLMQVRPAVWNLDKNKLKGSMEEQIKTGSEILHKYYEKLKSKDAALQAFNVGLTNYLKKKGLNPRYVPKFDDEREMYEGLSNDGETRRALLAIQELFSDFDDFDTELVHLEAGRGHRPRYRMKIRTPWAEMWVDLDSESSVWQKVSFGVESKIGATISETYDFDFHSEAELLSFVKKQYNHYINIKIACNAPMGLSGRRVDWSKYLLK